MVNCLVRWVHLWHCFRKFVNLPRWNIRLWDQKINHNNHCCNP